MTILETHISEYLGVCSSQKKLDAKTVSAYRIDLKQFVLFSQAYQSPMLKNCLSDYIASLHQRFGPKTVKRKIASLKALFNYLEFETLIPENPLRRIHISFHDPIVLPKALPLSTIKKLLKAAYANKNSSNTQVKQRSWLRNIAILELLFATGLRISELCSISIGSIDLREGRIRVDGKGKKERFAYITNKDVLGALKCYHTAFLSKITRSGWFFINRLGNRLSEQSVRIMISNLAAQARIKEHITPHMLRHSFATLLLEEDVDIRYIQSLLGHSSITTTQIYTHISANKQRSILAKKHPRNRFEP